MLVLLASPVYGFLMAAEFSGQARPLARIGPRVDTQSESGDNVDPSPTPGKNGSCNEP